MEALSVSQLLSKLPKEYAKKCLELGIIERKRGFKNPEDLMLLSLFHVVYGVSLITISEVGRLLKIADVSDVSFMKKFEKSGDWFAWISEQIALKATANYEKPKGLKDRRIIGVDASDVAEKGRSGRVYRLHYAMDIFKMCTADFSITTNKTGETLRNFRFCPRDIVIGDRAYGTINGITYIKDSSADCILRLRTGCFSMYDEDDKKINLCDEIAGLDFEESREINVFIKNENGRLPIRICVKKKSKEACKNSDKKLNRRQSKKQQTATKETIFLSHYIVLATTLSSDISCEEVLETYRFRWQVELVFKRLKSILDLGELPKKSEKSSLAWLNAKLMVALLVEQFTASACFSP
jgi:hypothetical protein